MASFFLSKNLFCKETLGNACMKWLPVLYYEGSRLNGLWSPFGFETQLTIVFGAGIPMAKWPVEPVRV